MEKEIALENREVEGERLFSPSAARNRTVIVEAFQTVAPTAGDVLEVGAGTGEHAMALAAASPGLLWRPGDPDARSRASIDAWRAAIGLANVAPAHALDVCETDWGMAPAALAAVVSINMIHIAPFVAAEGLFAGAGRYLKSDGILFLYGPFSREGVHTAPSNAAFDESLKSRNPSWGVRDLEVDLTPLASEAGLERIKVIAMPANNFSVVYKKIA